MRPHCAGALCDQSLVLAAPAAQRSVRARHGHAAVERHRCSGSRAPLHGDGAATRSLDRRHHGRDQRTADQDRPVDRQGARQRCDGGPAHDELRLDRRGHAEACAGSPCSPRRTARALWRSRSPQAGSNRRSGRSRSSCRSGIRVSRRGSPTVAAPGVRGVVRSTTSSPRSAVTVHLTASHPVRDHHPAACRLRRGPSPTSARLRQSDGCRRHRNGAERDVLLTASVHAASAGCTRSPLRRWTACPHTSPPNSPRRSQTTQSSD